MSELSSKWSRQEWQENWTLLKSSFKAPSQEPPEPMMMERLGAEVQAWPLHRTTNGTYRLRMATWADLNHFVDLEIKGYEGYVAWDLADFHTDWQQNPYGLYLMMESMADQKPVGILVGRLRHKGAHLSHLIIDPAHQRQGLADALLDCFLSLSHGQGIRLASLEVRQSNKPAQHLYQKHGFVIQHELPNYYQQNKESAYYMACILRQAAFIRRNEDDSVKP
ncbi:GNAT family N-acetyltransferase [Vaginisenegalia massiliensis]|uniref:GNAT family N-acetyltransferase n=1 Tax=Vaginisenegalia massiliensis TaxID=2058294 RepID=UPI0013DDE0B8|nr:N-acetyltransferase [Vaginisenegalia massiliensis]